MNQIWEKEKLIIKSNEKNYNSVINSNSNVEYSKINNYNCYNFDNKGNSLLIMIMITI